MQGSRTYARNEVKDATLAEEGPREAAMVEVNLGTEAARAATFLHDVEHPTAVLVCRHVRAVTDQQSVNVLLKIISNVFMSFLSILGETMFVLGVYLTNRLG